MTTAEKLIYKPPHHLLHITPYNYFMSIKLATPLPILAYLPMDGKLSNNPYCTYNRAVIGQGVGCIPAAGKVDHAMYYDGLNDYSSLNTPITAVTAFSYSFSCRKIYQAYWHGIIGYCDAPLPESPFGVVSNENSFYICLQTSAGQKYTYTIIDQLWHDYALTWDGATIIYYIDGDPTDTDPHDGTLVPSTTSCYLARSVPPTTRFANCYLDQILYGNWCMSPQEVRAQHLCTHAIFRELDK